MIIYTNGCSHTHGYACVMPRQTWPTMVMRSLDDDANYIFFHKEFGVDLNIEKQFIMGNSILFNEAQSGAGNDYIFHRTIKTFYKKLL